eukprot:4982366-Prymnesium_polylepis.1
MNSSQHTLKSVCSTPISHTREILRHTRTPCARGARRRSAQLAFRKRTHDHTMADREADVKYAAGGTAAAQLFSMGTNAQGPLRVSPQHMLCHLIGGYDARAPHAEIGMTIVPRRDVEGVMLYDASFYNHPIDTSKSTLVLCRM